MTSEDILYNSSIIIQEFDKELEKVDKERMLEEIHQSFAKSTITDKNGVEKVSYDFQQTFPQYQKLVSILGKLLTNWDDILGYFPMAHYILSKEIPKSWIPQIGIKGMNLETYIISRLGGKPKNFHDYSKDNPIHFDGSDD